jgi:hypothetical protein
MSLPPITPRPTALPDYFDLSGKTGLLRDPEYLYPMARPPYATSTGKVRGIATDASVVLKLAKFVVSKAALTHGAELTTNKKITQDTIRRWEAKIQSDNIRLCAKPNPDAPKTPSGRSTKPWLTTDTF